MGTQRSQAIYIQIPWQNYTIQSSSGSSLFGHLSNYFITKRENGEQKHCVSSKSQKNYIFLKWNCKRKHLNTLFEPRGIQILKKKGPLGKLKTQVNCLSVPEKSPCLFKWLSHNRSHSVQCISQSPLLQRELFIFLKNKSNLVQQIIYHKKIIIAE